MLMLLDGEKEKVEVQSQFERNLRAAWGGRESRKVSWKSGNGKPGQATMDIAHNQSYWFVSNEPHDGQNTKRYWNSFGRYQTGRPLQITVEINIATESDSKNVSGFFARDVITGIVCLMHDGGVGGGKKGVGKNAFLDWSKAKSVEVLEQFGNTRHGIVITHLSSKTIGEDIARFIEKVDQFKQAVRNGIARRLPAPKTNLTYDSEFAGIKKGARSQEIEYLTRHGEIVDALKAWREKQAPFAASERTFNNQLIDLGVCNAKNQILEIYEVKTNLVRQTLYTAIGQLVVHAGADARRFIVLPSGAALPVDVQRALSILNIGALRFTMTSEKVFIL